MREIRIAVVGSGLAGLTTAHLLRKRSRTLGDEVKMVITLLQSSSDLPTQSFSLPIADTEQEILCLVKELGLGLLPEIRNDVSPCSSLMSILVSEILCLRSKHIIEKPEDWSTKQSRVLDKLDSMSIIEYFVEKDKKADEVRSLLQTSWLSLYADNLDNLSTLDALRFLSQYLNCKFTYSIEGGNDYLLQALRDSLGADEGCIVLNKPVNVIESFDDQYRITFSNIDSAWFDYVVTEKTADRSYFKPGERRFIYQTAQSDSDLFVVSQFTSMGAPASMNGVVQSADRVVNRFLLPAIYETLPNQDDALTPEVPMAVFTSGNDSILSEEV